MSFRLKNGSMVLAVTLFLVFTLLTLGVAAPAKAAVPMTQDQKALADILNQARTNAGQKPLALDTTISGLALIKAQDMASNKYFSHNSPTYGSPFDMLKAAGVSYKYAGESLVKATSAAGAGAALTRSGSAAVCKSYYDKMGIGFSYSGGSKVFVVIYTGGGSTAGPKPQPQPQPVPDPAPVSGLNADEQQMLQLVNKERASAGLDPLTINPDLVRLARMKAQDMIDRGYFDHNSPTYGSPFDMMRANGIRYSYAGENLAGAPTVQSAHSNLMNSPGHRANILNANFSKVGIGVVSGGPYGKMFVQMFIG